MITAYYHGGRCCGIYHIYMGDYGCKPDRVLDAKSKRDIVKNPLRPDEVHSRAFFFQNEEFPSETALDRLDRIIGLLVAKRPMGIIEIVLVDYRYWDGIYRAQNQPNPYNQVLQWEALILERGFKKVSECKNSNSNNRMYVYHLIKDDK